MATEQKYFQWLHLLQEIQLLGFQSHLKGSTMDYIPLFSYHNQRIVISNSSRCSILFGSYDCCRKYKKKITFQDAKELGNKYFTVFVGDSIPDDIFDKYETEAPKLLELFDGKKPKLCGTRTLMRAPVILSRVEVMNTLFSFLFNDDSRSLGDSNKICKTHSESENSLINSSLFEYTGSVMAKWFFFLLC